MRLATIPLSLLLLTGCTTLTANTFYQGTFERQQAFCREHGKELMYDKRTRTGQTCMTKAEFQTMNEERAACELREGHKLHTRFFPFSAENSCWTEQEYATHQQQEAERLRYEAQMDLARMQALGMILGNGGMFRSFQPSLPYQLQPYQFQPAPVPSYQPNPVRSPVSCTSREVDGVLHTDCY